MSGPGGLSWSSFKALCAEVGQWTWGTVQGAFNEKASVSQILVDAIIGMIPLVGDVTAVRDLIAVSLGMIDDPKKREDKLEWVMLIVLVCALIPVIGGVIKGVGRLTIRGFKAAAQLTGAARVAKLQETGREIVGFLNRIGWKNGEAWFKRLRLSDYLPEVLGKFCELMDGLVTALRQTKQKVGGVLPNAMIQRMDQIAEGAAQLKAKGAEIIPEAVKEFDGQLREIQAFIHSGGETTSRVTAHAAVAGTKVVSKVEEVRILERMPTLPGRTVRGGRPQNVAVVGKDKQFAHIYKHEPGYPDLRTMGTTTDEAAEVTTYNAVAAYSGRIINRALNVSDGGFYRVFGPVGTTHGVAVKKSFAAGDPERLGSPIWAGIGNPPRSAEIWRLGDAVIDEWNRDLFLFVARLPQLRELKTPINGAFGTISEQMSKSIPGQYLPGNRPQAVLQLPPNSQALANQKAAELMDEAKDYIAAMNKANDEFLKTGVMPKVTVPPPIPKEWIDPDTGLECVIRATGWVDANGHWGYGVRPDRQMVTVLPVTARETTHIPKTSDEVFVK